jgi:hypothetical protein
MPLMIDFMYSNVLILLLSFYGCMQVVICTDGMANTGIGNLEGIVATYVAVSGRN